jgi:uncharacterized protein YutD
MNEEFGSDVDITRWQCYKKQFSNNGCKYFVVGQKTNENFGRLVWVL